LDACKEDNRIIGMKATEDSTFFQILKRHSSPARKISFSNEEKGNNSSHDSLSKLDKQVANLKRKKKNINSLGSPNKTSIKMFSLPNPLSNSDSINNKVNILNNTKPSVKSKTACINNLGSTKYKQNFTSLNSFDSEISLSNSSLSGNNSKINNRTNYLTTSELLIPDTQVIETFSTKDGKNNDVASKIRPEKAGSVNMFDSIPLANIMNNDSSVEVPDSNHSQESINLNSFSKQLISSIGKNVVEHDSHLFSSPIKKVSTSKQKKQVVFSSDIDKSPISSSPIKSQNTIEPRSILKSNDIENELSGFLSIDQILTLDLSESNSWQEGVVLQIPHDYNNLKKVIDECSNGLISKNFTRKYEVYATLNHLLKANTRSVEDLNNFFNDQNVKNIIMSVEKDLIKINKDLKQGTNAFQLRLASQGIKLVTLLSYVRILTNLDQVYDLIINILRNENIPKSLVSAIIQFLKTITEGYYNKMEKATIAIIQMKYFSSSSITSEKLNLLKKFIILKPALLNNCNYQILSHLLYSILNTDVAGYSKILLSSISVLTCIARNGESKLVMAKLLSEEIESSFTSFNQNSSTKFQSWMTIGHAICETLDYLIYIELYSHAAKIWTYLLYMTCYNRPSFNISKWELNTFSYFKKTFMNLFTKPQGFVFAIESWKVIIYNFQIMSIKNQSDDELKTIIDLLMLPFKMTNVESIDHKISQWTYHQGFIILYSRIFYALRLHMEESLNESHQAILFEAMLTPLMNLEEWDLNYAFILQMIFTADRFIYVEPAESCFWLSDYEKWKSRIIPIPKKMFKNEKIFNIIIKTADKLSNTSLDLVSNFIDICIFEPLASLKLKSTFKEFMTIADLISDFLIEVFQKYANQITNAKQLFRLIENTDADFIFLADSNLTYLMTRLLNCLKENNQIEVVNDFIKLCEKKFGKDKLFISCLISDLYNNEKLILDDDDNNNNNNIPYFLHYTIDLIEFKFDGENFELTALEQGKLINNIKQMAIVLNNSNFEIKFELLINFIRDSNIFQILNDEFRFNLFTVVFEIYNKNQNDLLFFYKIVPESFLEYALFKFNKKNNTLKNAENLITFISKFTDFKYLPEYWISLIGSKLVYLLHPDLQFEEWFVIYSKELESRLPKKFIQKVKKLAFKKNCLNFPLIRSTVKLVDNDNNRNDLTEDNDGEVINMQLINENTSFTENDLENKSNNDLYTRIIESSNHENKDEDDKEKGEPIAVENLKSFIIDSIQIDGANEEPTIRIASSPEKMPIMENLSVETSPAKRTRSQSNMIEFESLDEWSAKRRKQLRLERKIEKRERKERRRRSRSRSIEIENQYEYSGINESIAHGEDDTEYFKNDIMEISETDMDQFRILLKKMNQQPILIEKLEKEELEIDLVSLLLKLKKGQNDNNNNI
jgi:hypothetical protein